jgi:hypothetical protein
MKTSEGPDVFGYTVFCDDIRIELGGKVTFVGAYTAQMFVHGTFPATLPKFALGVFYSQKKSAAIWPTKIWAFMPGDSEEKPSFEMVGPEDEETRLFGGAQIARASMGLDEGQYFANFFPIVLANLVLPRPGQIKVRAVRGDELFRLGALEILQSPGITNQPPVPT